jgi:CheY-like chemotaxis protein
MMPVMDGSRRSVLRATGDRRIPVVILSGSPADVRQRCHDLGARAFLLKP